MSFLKTVYAGELLEYAPGVLWVLSAIVAGVVG